MSTLSEIIEEQLSILSEHFSKNHSRYNNVISIIVDGSFVRGDFLDNNSDIDITITVNDVRNGVNKEIVHFLNELEANLPKRDVSHKPLKYDVQWQSYSDVLKLGKLSIDEWNGSLIPSGYPKLWLYAFDVVNHHRVIYGPDVTVHYSRIDPDNFVALRIERLKNACVSLMGNIGNYEIEHGGITQIKNTFEIMRALYLSKGFKSINKHEVCNYYLEDRMDEASKNTSMKLIKYILYQKIDDISIFRKELYEYSMKMIEEYEKQGLTQIST